MKEFIRMKVTKLFSTVLMMLVIGAAAMAQAPVKVQKAELSIPFGVVKGKLVAVGDTLVFVDEEMPDASFSIEKATIRNFSEADGVITIDTNRPIKDRSGERNKLAFRLSEGNGAGLAAWFKDPASLATAAVRPSGDSSAAKTTTATASPTPTMSSDGTASKVYQARQKRFPMGSTDGKLVLSENEIAFESLNDIKRSQRWSYRDIKEIKQESTYLIEIVPFRGDKYKLELQGEGMSSAQFKSLEDRIAAARTTK
jgi:hypothetical protein